MDATKTERALVLFGFKPRGSKLSSGSNKSCAVLLRGSPQGKGLETWWSLQRWWTKVSRVTLTTSLRSEEQREPGLSNNCSGKENHQSENPITKQVSKTNRRSLQYEYTSASESGNSLILLLLHNSQPKLNLRFVPSSLNRVNWVEHTDSENVL